jgi:protein TonB
MTWRYAIAAVLAAGVTLVVLLAMQLLVTGQRGEIQQVSVARVVDFVRLRREREPETKPRELPQRAAPQPQPPPPEMQLSNVPDSSPFEIAAAMPELEVALELGRAGEGVGTGAGGGGDVVPLVRVNPQYPSRAMQRGVEGYVHLSFTVTRAGTVEDVEVLRSEPKSYFEDAAIAAVRKYRYKPKMENGSPVERPGVEVVLAFKLNR